jgi:hypothetical protein
MSIRASGSLALGIFASVLAVHLSGCGSSPTTAAPGPDAGDDVGTGPGMFNNDASMPDGGCQGAACDDATLASVCGNGVVEPGETCDPPTSTTCTASCQTKLACTETGGYSSPINGHCYFEVDNSVSYMTARTDCPAGTHLATLGDAAESEAAQLALSATYPDAWIALRAPTDVTQFAWDESSSEPFLSRRYHGFLLLEPNTTNPPACARVSLAAGWKDKDCSGNGNTFATMCERE